MLSPADWKACSRCGVSKAPERFAWRNARKAIRHRVCKDCFKPVSAKHYLTNKAAVCARRDRNKQEAARLVREAKGKPCADCAQEHPYYVMDLDHRPGETKCFELAMARRYSIRQVVAEIAKCDPVCANCHRKRSHTRRMPT